MSRPFCQGWTGFLDALNAGLGIPGPTAVQRLQTQGVDALYRCADKAVFALRLLPENDRRQLICTALVAPGTKAALPGQACALARGYWPLIISTNYDDVLLAAFHATRPKEDFTDPSTLPWILGRSGSDCETVVRSLDTNHPPIAWHIQGFVGGVAPHALPRVRPAVTPDPLLDQVVIGHQQYQQAANRNPEFRRAFAEIYRRRSLLFVGSGLAESYFVNLISEVILAYGPSPQPHFALFADGDVQQSPIDSEFLQVRLGITPVRYGGRHDELIAALERICPATQCDVPAPAHVVAPRPLSLSFGLPRQGAEQLELSLRFQKLKKPAGSACSVLSVGQQKHDDVRIPLIGQMVQNFIGDHYADRFARRQDQDPLFDVEWECAEGRLFRLAPRGTRLPVYMLAAREGDLDQRSLAAVTDATCEALDRIERNGEFDTVVMGLLSAGSGKNNHPTFSLIAQLSGIRRFAAQRSAPCGRALKLVEIDIVDPRVIAPIVDGRIPIQEILSSDRTRVFVRVSDALGRREAFTVNVPSNATVDKALEHYQLNDERIKIDVAPLPYPGYSPPRRAPVFPTMIIDVYPRS